MASQKRSSSGDKKEGLLEAVVGILLTILVLGGYIWFVASQKIVYYSAPGLRWMGAPWAFFNEERWAAINEGFVFFRNSPRQVPLTSYVGYANACLKPLAILLCAAALGYLVYRIFSKNSAGNLRRRLDPMQAAYEIAKTFPAIMPVLHLGPDLVADKLPLWRRQTFPEDIWTKEKVGGRTLAAGNKLSWDRTTTYFRGGEVKDGPHQKRNGRRWSRMLGFLVVDLVADIGNQEKICFPDRFSPQGKVLFALLCAYAFGGREGKEDYKKAADAINQSALGQKNGLPNLTVAQWLYNKYRMDKTARMLFRVHHWEYTYLTMLFRKAKINGKTTHTDFIWLKPMDRILFYVLNTEGRQTPHAEASAAFSQLDYEYKAARNERLPLRLRSDGTIEANIVVHTSVEGLNLEFVRYLNGTDENDDWWQKIGVWDASQRIAAEQESLKEAMAEIKASKSNFSKLPVQPDTEADLAVREKIKAEDAEATQKGAAALAGALAGSDFDLV